MHFYGSIQRSRDWCERGGFDISGFCRLHQRYQSQDTAPTDENFVPHLSLAGYQLYIDAKGVPATYQHLRVRLRIEQTRLLNWGQKIGLVEELLDEPSRTLHQNRNLIIDILFEIQALLKSCVVMEAKFDRFAPQKQMEMQKRIEPNQDAFDQRFPKRKDKFLSKTLSVLEKSSDIKRRLHWAMVKKDQFETMIQKLIGYNTSIEALLDSTAINQLQHMEQQIHMALLQLNSNVIELKEVSMALKVKPAAGPDQVQLQIGPFSERPPNGDVDIARLADFKATQIQVETQTSEVILDPIVRASIRLHGASHEYRSEALFENRPVWIEWKYIDIDLNLHPKWKFVIEQRIKKLALLLQPANKPPEFNVPQCLGYFFDDDHDVPNPLRPRHRLRLPQNPARARKRRAGLAARTHPT